jgi:hypothetical protein
MSNGEICCLMGVCCPPEAQEAALATFIAGDDTCDQATAEKVAKRLLKKLDLAPKGFAKLAREMAGVE